MRPIHWTLSVLLLICCFVLPAGATICAQDTVPAATLLVPYFEVDLDHCDRSTRITVTNASSESTLVEVTVWSDLGVASLDFNIYLTGYDVQTFDMGDMLCDGEVPSTGAGVSPHGQASGPPGQYPNCNASTFVGDPPVYPSPAISSSFKDHLQAWLTGQASPVTHECAGISHGDNVARGFVTIDVVKDCSILFPDDPGYFENVASSDNVLMGEYVLTEGPSGTAGAFSAVHIEARNKVRAGQHSFYGRYLDGDGSDRREALSSSYASRFHSGPESEFASTSLFVWREGDEVGSPFTCGEPPLLPAARTFFFDEEENVAFALVDLPGQANRYDLTEDGKNPYDMGWARLNLRHEGIVYGDNLAQSWVTTALSQGTGFQGGMAGTQIGRVCGK